ncbi:winged helix-turn-helix domain-containing protein [Plantactinospora sp. WMMB334]|uniref:winged helix-turn-helix domain-containing protein n=1 Tax=Plantactinospora sp. WMMB334 TaxID=3404119 RepID=UPI003B92D95F
MPPSPKWVELAERIRRQIESGELSPGDKLPSTSQLCDIYGVSSIVVRNAMLTLKAEGLVVGVPGVGVYVAEK